jgi:hypothetical protein
MILREFFRRKLVEGGNLEVDGAQAQQIDLKVHNRAYIVPILSQLLNSINAEYQQSVGGPLWNPKVLKSRKYLSGSSLHFFNTDIPDEEFERVKPKVGDIDTQVNRVAEPQLAQWLDSVKGQVVGNSKFLGYSRGNEQYSSLWELTDPPIKVQIDFEFVDYSDKDEPTDWAGFSHSSSWDDLSQGIKGVFHKYIIQAFTRLTTEEFILRKMVGRGKARVEQDIPTTDNMFSFAVSSKEGGGLRPKYEPVLDEKGNPLVVDGMSVMRPLPTSGYEKDLGKIFQSIFGKRVDSGTLKTLLPKTWSFVGLLEIMNLVLPQEEKEQILDAFVDKLFSPGAQGLYKGDPQRDTSEKNSALNYALKVLQIEPPKNLEQMRQDYLKNYKVTTEGPIGLDQPMVEADEEQPAVKAQLRKGMPHLRDLKPADFLDLVDELKSEGGKFKLENIPLNVKIDGFGGRFGKNADGQPFMGTSRTEPKYKAGFADYHKQKGTTDPEVLGRAANFDKLFNEIMDAIKVVDSKLGPDFLVDKQVTCEVLFLPFATQTEEGKLKFVGIEYDQLPQGVDLVLVPYNIVEGSTGTPIPNGDEIVQQIAELGQSGNVMFMSNRLVQDEGLDVTEIINPLDNLEELKQIVSDTAGKRDRASIQLRREVEEKLKPVQIALEKAIDEDPNIVGKDKLGQEYEGIVINSRLGPIKVTSQRQKDIISQKNAARAAARSDKGRDNANKTAVVAVGSFVGHRGHEDLFNYTIDKAKEVGGDPYLFIGNAEGKDDPIPPAIKVQTWHKLYPQYAKNISTVIAGGSLIQKIKHELINPLPGKPPRYDNIIIMVGEDRAGMTMPNALMKAVNKFQGYEHVKVSLEVTPRESGFSGTMLRNSLKNDPPETALAKWSKAFDVEKLGVDWVEHLMDITRKGMGIQQPTQQPVQQQPVQQPAPVPVAEVRLFNALVRPTIMEVSDATKKSYKEKATAQVKELEPWTKKGEYKDIAKRAIQRREKGLEKVKDVGEDHSTMGGWGKGAYDTYSGTRHGRGVAEDAEPMDREFALVKKLGRLGERVVQNPKLWAKYDEAIGNNDNDWIISLIMDGTGATFNEVLRLSDLFGEIGGGLGRIIDFAWSVKEGHWERDFMEPYRKHRSQDLDEFAPAGGGGNRMGGGGSRTGGDGGDNDGGGDDPYKYPQPEHYSRSIDFFGRFEADHFDDEEFDKATGVFKGYWDDQEGRDQIAYFKFDNPQRTGDDDSGMGWYYEPQNESVAERMLPKSAFAGSDKNKLGPAGQWKNTGPKKNKPAKAGDLVGSMEEEKQRLDPKCWKGYRKSGTKMKGGVRVNNCVPVSEDVENIFATLIDKIIINEAIQNNKR